MHDLTTHIMENVLPEAPVRQWVLSPPFEIAPLLAVRPKVLTHLIRCFVDAISKQMKAAAGNTEGKLHTGGIVFIQRFTKSITLFPHLHILMVDGVYAERPLSDLDFIALPAPCEPDLLEVGKSVFHRMERYLKWHGYIDAHDGEPQILSPLEKWWMKATAEPSLLMKGPIENKVPFGANYGGFNIHAGVRIKQGNRKKREQLVRYVTRPPFSEDQLSRTDDGRVRLELRSSTKAGQTSVLFHPVPFLRRLAWQVPPPRQNQVRYFGVFGPTHSIRARVVPRPPPLSLVDEADKKSRYRVPWATLISKVYDVDAQVCQICQEPLRPVDAVTDYDEAARELRGSILVLGQDPNARAPPAAA